MPKSIQVLVVFFVAGILSGCATSNSPTSSGDVKNAMTSLGKRVTTRGAEAGAHLRSSLSGSMPAWESTQPAAPAPVPKAPAEAPAAQTSCVEVSNVEMYSIDLAK
jgi:hypothetical protein